MYSITGGVVQVSAGAGATYSVTGAATAKCAGAAYSMFDHRSGLYMCDSRCGCHILDHWRKL